MTNGIRTPGSLRLPAHRHPTPTRTRVRTRRLPVTVYVAVLLALPSAVLLGARSTGWWINTGHTVPATALGAPAFDNADAAAGRDTGHDTGGQRPGTMNPQDVKGSTTVQQVLDAFPQVSAAEIFDLFGAPADTATSTPLKTLARNSDGIEVTDLREWLENHRSVP